MCVCGGGGGVDGVEREGRWRERDEAEIVGQTV